MRIARYWPVFVKWHASLTTKSILIGSSPSEALSRLYLGYVITIGIFIIVLAMCCVGLVFLRSKRRKVHSYGAAIIL